MPRGRVRGAIASQLNMSIADPPGPDPDNPVGRAGLQRRKAWHPQLCDRFDCAFASRKNPRRSALFLCTVTGFTELFWNAPCNLRRRASKPKLCKVLEYIPLEDNRLLLRAGVGWDPGLVGTASVGADLESPSGFALRTSKPVIPNHLEHEETIATP